MRLASALEVLQTMGVVPNPGSIANAGQSLELAYPILECLLETGFQEQEVTDYFDTNEGGLCFRLTNSFVDISTVVVRVSSTTDALLLSTDGDLLPSSAYMVNADLGTITLRSAVIEGDCLLSVSYNSGFPLAPDETDILSVPQWLREAAIATAVHVQNTFVSSPANRKDKSVTAVSNEIRTITSLLINSRKRPRMRVVFPALSVVND